MSNDWAIEAHDTTGRRFLYRRITTRKKIGKLIAQIMTNETTGGIVIYRSIVAESNKTEVVVGAMDYWPAGDPDDGRCKTCGCPPENMPMVNRGTGWCSEAHRKEQLARSNKDD